MRQKFKLPKRFKAHDGKQRPVNETTFVEALTLTAEGIGSGGIMRARVFDWVWENGVAEIGDVVGYRVPKTAPGARPEALLNIYDRYDPKTGELVQKEEPGE